MVSRQQALDVLRQFKTKQGAEYGILSLGVFGSLARDQGTPHSDVDVVVETGSVDPFRLVHLKEHLELLLDSHVDIVRMRKNMNRFLKKRIEKEAVYV